MRSDSRSSVATYGGAVVVAGIGVLALALWFGGGRPQPTIPGLPSPGPVTTWGLPLVRLVHDGCAVVTVGILLTAVVLAPPGASRVAITRAARWWALAWALSAALTFILTLSDFIGLPVNEALSSGALISFSFYIPQGRAFLLVTILTLVIAIVSAAENRLPAEGTAELPSEDTTERESPAGGPVKAGLLAAGWGKARPQVGGWVRVGLLALALFAVLPPAYVGHSASAADHNLAVSSLMLHIAAVALWVGGLFGVLVCLRGVEDLAGAVRRFSTLALCCFVAVGVSGVINAWIRLGGFAPLVQSRYGLLVLGKVAALMVLGLFGWTHRRTTITAIETQTARRPFLRLAGGEIVVMAAAIGLAIALSRTPPPVYDQVHAHDEALGYTLPAFGLVRLLTQTRPDPLVLLPLLAAAVVYLWGVWRLSRAGGERWPIGRTGAWLAGVLVLAYALGGGVSAYAPAMFAAWAAQFALAGVVAPALLVFGAPLTLALRVTSPASPFGDAPRRAESSLVLRGLTHPVVAFAVYTAPYVLLYLVGLFDPIQSSYALRLVTLVLVVAGGALFFAVVAGVDPLPRPIGLPNRLHLLGGAIAVQALAALFLLAGPVRGQDWYAYLALPWEPSRVDDQQLGALLGLSLGVATLLVLTMMLLRWQRAAERRVQRSPSSGATV